MTKLKKSVALILLIAAAALPLLCPRAAQAADKYVFVVPMDENFSYGALENLLKDIGKQLSAKTGLKFEAVQKKYKHGTEMSKIVLSEFNSGRGHFAFIYAQDFVRMPEFKSAADAMFSFTINGKTTSTVCAFVRKSDGITGVQQLKGKKWGMNALLPTFWALHKAGVKEDPKKFFSSLQYMDDSPSTKLLDALLSKKIDVFIASTPMFDMAMNNDAKYSKAISKIACVDYDHNLVFISSKKTPKDVVEKVRTSFMNAHKDKQFQNFWFLFKAIKGHFVAYEEKNAEGTRELVKLAEKNGWYAKEKEFIKSGK